MRVKKAIILVAGLGIRLKPLTDEVPKCLTEINGKPILLNTLEILEKNGFEEAVLVIGYKGEEIIKKVCEKYKDMKITYIRNDIFDVTNTMYSVLEAKEHLKDGVLLIEGDTYFEEDMIKEVLDMEGTFWLGQKFTEEYQGCMLTVDDRETWGNNRIIEIQIKLGELSKTKGNDYKSTGILKISPEFGEKFAKWLEEEENTDVYYDLVINKHLNEHAIFVHDITGYKWVEIDSIEDINKAEKIFTPRKYVIVVLDGAGDVHYDELDKKTPLEFADISHIDHLAKKGTTGIMKTMYNPLPIGSIVAMLGILGYNPLRYYPNGRSSFEALAHDIFMNEGDIAFRLNLVSIEDNKLKDFTANNISPFSAKRMINGFPQVLSTDIELYHGQGYRNFCIVRDANINPGDIISQEPHMNIGKNIYELLLKGKTKEAIDVVEQLNNITKDSIQLFSNEIMKEIPTKATTFYFWSPSSEPHLTSFHKRFGIDGAIIAGVDFLRGIGIAGRMEAKKVPEATGDVDTNLLKKLNYTINSLKHNDLVVLHINALDEISHRKQLSEKVKYLEKINREIILPLITRLELNYDKFRVAVVVDHYTQCKDGKHTDDFVPFLICGDGVKPDNVKSFSESVIEANGKTITKSYEFMDLFLGG